MCTGFVRKGNDLLYGFNLDIDPAVWDFGLYKKDSLFTVGIKVGKTLYYTHGVNRDGHFGNLPYCNDNVQHRYSAGKRKERIDLITDRYIRNKYSFEDVMGILGSKTVVNIPNCSMHTLLADAAGHILIIEPGHGCKEVTDDFAVIANFPLLADVSHYEPFHGKDRYDKAYAILAASDDSFSAMDGIRLLREVKQEGQWATRISFVYSSNEKCVYYVLDNQFDSVEKHFFR